MVRPIGAGGQGSVLLAQHVTTRRQGALKVVNADGGTDDPALIERFRREVEVLAQLDHPAVVGLLDAGELGEGRPWLVTEYIAGETVEARLRRGEPMAPDRALIEFTALADGLAHAHARGIHHRDIKSENVVVATDGRAVLVDFGVALRFGASRLTRAGNVMGTMAYLPPEVLEGAEPDPASSDQYALGMLLSEALAGAPAFRSAGDGGRARFGALVTAKADPLDPGAAFPERVRAAVRRATHPEPAERFPDMAAFARELEALVPAGKRADLDRRLGRPARRWPRSLLIGAALIATSALLGAFALGSLFILLLLVFLAGR